MPLHVVDGEEGFVQGAGHALGSRATDEQRRSKARTTCGGKGIDLIHGHVSLLERFFDETLKSQGMITRGELGHHAAVLAV